MKRIYSIVAGIVMVCFTACTDSFDEINHDKHEFVKVEPEYLFASAIKGSMNLIAQLNSRVYWQATHHLTVSYGSATSFGASHSEIDGLWGEFYKNIALLRQIQKHFDGSPGYENRVQIAKVWESYMFYIFTTTFGGVPYTYANRDDMVHIPFDEETEIYVQILNVLKTASETLDPEKDKLQPDAVFPDSDINKWKRFAVATRLKIALETQNAIPQIAAEHGSDVVTNYEPWLLKSNAENLAFKWGGSTSFEYSDYYNTFLFNSTRDLPALSHVMFLYYRSYADPRMEAIFDKVQGQFLIFDSLYTDNTFTEKKLYRYAVPYNAKEKTTQKADLGENDGYVEEVADPYRSMSANQYSYLKTDYLKADAKQNLVWFADVCFMQAEARLLNWGGSKSVEQYYQDGIAASFDYFGVGSKAAAYINQPGVQWNSERLNALPDHRMLINANITNDPLHKIIVQRWLAGIFYGSHDAYCYIRRTRLISLLPHFAASADAFGAGGRIANMPERMQYANSEHTYNTPSYTDAVSRLQGGFDFLTSYLKMAKEYDRKNYEQWSKVSLLINNRVWVKWYGQTEQDLIDAGLVLNQSYFIEN